MLVLWPVDVDVDVDVDADVGVGVGVDVGDGVDVDVGDGVGDACDVVADVQPANAIVTIIIITSRNDSCQAWKILVCLIRHLLKRKL